MRPKQLMLVGLLGLIASVMCEVASANIGSLAVFAFANGMVFGKGYGVWEERQERKRASQ